jgi:endo-1,4-beta-xylanase
MITFGNHVSGWRKFGLHLGALGYQVLATEGFGSNGRSDISMADR